MCWIRTKDLAYVGYDECEPATLRHNEVTSEKGAEHVSPKLLRSREPKRNGAARRLLMLLLLAAVGLGTSCGVPGASGGPAPSARPCGTWGLTPTADPTTRNGLLNAVAAISPHDVWAVGSSGLGSALVERWNGRHWRIVPAPKPLGSALLAITAVSANDIWAVGSQNVSDGDVNGALTDSLTGRPLIEHWNGVAWRQVRSPSLGGGELDGISGLTARDVWAVGQGGNSPSLVEHWNGSAWSAVKSPQPSAARLESVAAVSPRNVWAVGTVNNTTALIEHWNGHSWATVRSHSLSGDLHTVAAVSASDIWAVGQDPVTLFAIAEHWNGRRWSVVRTAALGSQGSETSELNSLAAVSSKDVWAVGDQSNRRQEHRLIERWNGRHWRAVRGMDPGRRHSDLFGVAAASPASVWAVGSVGVGPTRSYGQTTVGVTLAGRWNGRKWRAVRSPNPSGASAQLQAVDASSASDGWAVGDSLVQGASQGLAEQWKGSRWAVVHTPRIRGRNVYLNAVEAVASNNAWAVGVSESVNNSDPHRLIEHWNGHRWSIIAGANGAPLGELSGVSAVSSSDVWVAGYAKRKGTAAAPFIERWNGSAWKRVVNPPHMHQTSAIVVVSGPDVWVSSNRGTVDHWNGTRWTRSSTSAPRGRQPRWNGLAGSSSGDVWSVGYSDAGQDYPYLALGDHWNGASWNKVHTVSPGSDNNVFQAITEIAPSNVWAVGTTTTACWPSTGTAGPLRLYRPRVRYRTPASSQALTERPAACGPWVAIRGTARTFRWRNGT